MKESLVKQAARTHWSESTYKEDAELAYDDCDCLSVIALAKSIALRAFEKGTEWQAKQSPWISVADKEPEEFKNVLLSAGSCPSVFVGYFNGEDFVVGNTGEVVEYFRVLHWMQIP